MKLPLALVLAALMLTGLVWAGSPGGFSHPGPGRPDHPTGPIEQGPGTNRFTPYQPKSGVYRRPTPVPTERKISVLADLEITIQPGDNSYMLHILSSLPVRNFAATNMQTGVELTSVRLDDAVDFRVEVDGQPNSATALTLDVNMGVFKGQQRIRKAVFDLLETAVPADAKAKTQAGADKPTEKAGEGDEPLPVEVKAESAPE